MKNYQHRLAETLLCQDIQVIKENYEASLKIKRWRLINSLPLLSTIIKRKADSMITESFLSYISSTDLLITEGYYTRFLDN